MASIPSHSSRTVSRSPNRSNTSRSASVRGWLHLWPPTVVIEHARAALLTGGLPPAPLPLLLAGMTAAILAAGIFIYRAYEPGVAEYV